MLDNKKKRIIHTFITKTPYATFLVLFLMALTLYSISNWTYINVFIKEDGTIIKENGQVMINVTVDKKYNNKVTEQIVWYRKQENKRYPGKLITSNVDGDHLNLVIAPVNLDNTNKQAIESEDNVIVEVSIGKEKLYKRLYKRITN